MLDAKNINEINYSIRSVHIPKELDKQPKFHSYTVLQEFGILIILCINYWYEFKLVIELKVYTLNGMVLACMNYFSYQHFLESKTCGHLTAVHIVEHLISYLCRLVHIIVKLR